jgi:hypothetical protein
VSVSNPPGQGCGHELKPGAQFCTVCGSRVGDDGRRTALVAEEQVPALAPQPTVPSGVHRGSSLSGYPPGQGCGHELKPGAQFCTVCGSRAADDGRRTALVAEEQVPAPGPEATVIRPVPAQPEPVNPTSPATVTSWPQERPSGVVIGSGPQRGWPDPSPAPGGTAPPQGRRHHTRWPLVIGVVALLAAGGAATVLIVQPFHHSPAAAGTPRTSPAAQRLSLSGSATATPSSAPATPSSATATPSSPSAQQAAASLAGLLAQSVTDRSSTVNAVNSISKCGPTLSQGPQVLESAAASRQRLVSQLASLPGRSALPAQMLQALTGAWQASATADRDFAQWAQDELSRGCIQNDEADPNFQAAAAPDAKATTGKKAFVKLWNPIAAQYGLTTYRWNQL